MGSHSLPPTPSTPLLIATMPDATSLLMPLKELLNDEDFVSTVESTAKALPRLFYQNSVLTIDTHVYFLWATVILAVLLALAYLIFGDWSKLDILASTLSSGSSGYGQAYKSEDMLNELQHQVADLQTRLVSDPSGNGENNYNSFDYTAAGYSS